MKVISIGTDRKIFEENSAVRQRMIEYGKLFDELHIVIFSKRNSKYSTANLINKYQISNNVFAYPTNSASKWLYVWDAFFVAKKIIGKSGELIVTTQDPFETGLVGVFIKLFFDLPLHVQIHTDLMNKYFRQSSLLNRFRFMMMGFVLRYSDRVRAVSERIKKSIIYFSQNVDVLPIMAGIKEREMEKNAEIKKPFPFTLIMVCRIEREKNIETIFRVLKNLNKNIGLLIVGDGSQMQDLEKMANNIGILERVMFVGWQNNLAPYYKMADAFISSSLYEGYGVSTMEAAHFGKPLILSETGIAEEIFDENSAFICDAKDSNCFAQSVLKIYQNKDLAKKMGQSAKITADKHLNSVKNYFKEYADSIIQTANDSRKRSIGET